MEARALELHPPPRPAEPTPPTRRPVVPEDTPFLRTLHDELRAAELDAWGWPASAREAFLDLQFRAWCPAVAFAPGAALVLDAGVPVGLLIVTDAENTRRLTEIALSAAARGRGLGTALIRDLQAAGRPITLHVLRGSPALGLYTRLGFVPTDDDGVRIGMCWSPAGGGTT